MAGHRLEGRRFLAKGDEKILSAQFLLAEIKNSGGSWHDFCSDAGLREENKFVCQELIVAICCFEPESVSFQERGGRL